MSDAAPPGDGASTEVCLIPENQHCGEVALIQKAELAPGGSLLACLGPQGRLVVWDPADREAPPAAADGRFTDFSWEEGSSSGSGFRLLGVKGQRHLELLQVEAQPSASVCLVSSCELPAEDLLQSVREQGHDVPDLQSVLLLSFAAGRCFLLLNSDWLLQLQAKAPLQAEAQLQAEAPLQTVSCCRLQLQGRAAVHHCVCGGSLFALSADGLISVLGLSDGRLLASVDLPSYLNAHRPDDDLRPLPSTFCLLQLSADLSTAVALSRCHGAVAVDLNHYFRTNPHHLLCEAPPTQPQLWPQHLRDQDSVVSSNCSLQDLDPGFSTDRSWETRLASMYSRVQPPSAPSWSSGSAGSSWSSWSSWSSCLRPVASHQAPSSAHSRVPPGGASVDFVVPEASAPSQLTVSEFSAQLTFVTPGNQQTTVALWDLESGGVSYHQVEGEAAPVQRCGERQHRLLLKRSGLFQVLWSVSQDELLGRLMLFGSAATVDALCHLNRWGRCSVPVHALQAGLKNRQLDTVEFYLKSKENLLDPAAASCSLSHSVQQLCPALDLLCSAVRDSHSEAQSRQFSEQLLSITMSFIHGQIRSLLSGPQHEGADVQSCVDVLDRYVTALRSYMNKFPWPAGGDTGGTDPPDPAPDRAEEEEWAELQPEEVVRRCILTNQIPRAQAALRRRGRPERRLAALRMEGLRQVFSCLERRDLPTATALLANMGFSVRKQLHRICLYTDDKELRDFMVEELSGRSCLSEEELQSVAFIREMEKLGALPPRPERPRPQSLVQVLRLQGPGPGEGTLEELLGLKRSEDDAEGLWINLRLDWVKNWDHGCQMGVLLSRLQHTELASCDSAVLWRYLTALHHQHLVEDWIQTSSGSRWPELSPELVDGNTACSSFMREKILDLLAQRGLFVPEELQDLDLLLWRLAQGGGLMAPSPPVPQYRSQLGLDLHASFISWCQDQGLQYLLYCYLDHYRLTPRNCPLLTGPILSEGQPWLEMLVKIQEITRDLSDPGLLFQASLTSAQVLLPGSQGSLSSLLLEGHSLLALATIVFGPGGVDQVLARGDRWSRAERTLDPQLLKMALGPHPKLKAALFPSGPRGPGTQTPDTTLYHLLQALAPLDPSRLFGWQGANTLHSAEAASELPHFSSPQLVHRYALVENLDFLFYLRHGRPSFAFATFLLQQLSGAGGDVAQLLQQTQQQLHRLALQSFNVAPVAAAAVCFCQLLGVCSLKLRVDVRVLNTVLQHRVQQHRVQQHRVQQHTHTAAQQLQALGGRLAEAEPGAAEELIGFLEAAVADSVEQRGFSRSSYEAAQEWALPVQFCQLHGLTLSAVYPAHCADDGQFVHFLLFVQLHSFPPQQVRSLVARFSPALQAHLSLAFQDLQVCSGGRSPEPPTELFQVLLQSQEEAAPCRYLLQEALSQRCPTLAVMAACQQGAEPLPCLCAWVLTTVDDVTAGEATSHLMDPPPHHDWTLHDLSIIWKTLLGRGHVRPLLRGFELFQKDCPLVLVLRMFELCCDFRNFSEAKAKLLDFQRTLVSLRSGGAAPPGGLPLQWVESQASALLLTVLQRCSSQFDLHRLLQLLADVDKLLKSNGPDFRKLSQLSQLLQGSEVSLSPRLLGCTSADVQQEEFQAAVDALQARGRYSQARQVAQLAGLSVHRLLLSQLLQDAVSQKSKQQWSRLETRVAFWRRSHEQLKADGTDPESASHFFLSQSDPGSPDPPAEAGAELVEVQERCLLLCLAAHWLALLSPPPVDRLEILEKRLWLSRVRRRVLAVAVETQSVFNLPPPAVTAETNTYESLMKEFSFSSISSLNTDTVLGLQGLPGPSEEPAESGPALSPEERGVLAQLVGQLLYDGSIHEASRVCRYFALHHPDMWLVLRCRGLASGDLDPEAPEAPEEASDAPPAKSLSSSSSVSSLLSFSMLPLPDDGVAVQLQRLVDRCRHGNTYCKQVLGLYQLSKELQCSFFQICSQEPGAVLERLLLSEQPERFRKAQAFIRAQGLSADSVAQLVSGAVVQALLASTQELQPERQVFRPSDGRDSLVQLIKLCDDPNLVGLKLLQELNCAPLRDLSCIVELLVVAHDCFSLTCNMEGIVRVLQAARHLSHTYLAPGEHFNLLVRLLTGIGRYNEMTYVFDLLHQNHRFEMLLRKKLDADRGQSCSLKTALLDYIKRCLPADSEKHNMVALCFSMRREIGENHEMAARTQLKIIESQPWVVSAELKNSLLKVLGLLKDAAESFSKDSCVRQATRCVRSAKLVALQLHFLNQGSDLRVVNLRPAELLAAVTALPRCYQVLVVSEAYSYSPDWAEVLYQKVILNGDFAYLDELKRHRPLTSALFEDVFKKLDAVPSSSSGGIAANVRRLLTHCDDVYSRYRLAYQHQLHDVTKALLQDAKTSSYLNDRLTA